MTPSIEVAVVGAGAAGLVAARELKKEGHRVQVFERSDRLGGIWVYDPRVESDLLGQDPNREIVHSSMYLSLRTNLPRQLMSFSGFPFSEKTYGDPRTFPSHQEVLSYLTDFATEFGLLELIRFNTEVVRVKQVNKRWLVESISKQETVSSKQVFDSVVICNGHCTVPRVCVLPGIEKWPGKQIHSHNYRTPTPFTDQVVVLIGNGPSAFDISREISKVAKELHLSSRSPTAAFSHSNLYPNVWHHSEIVFVNENSIVAFRDGSSVQADIIFYCTGYKYEFPFLETDGVIVDENRVRLLYKHVFPPKLAPNLSFVGLLHKTIIFSMMEVQAQWIAKVLSGKARLPSSEEMIASVEDYYFEMKKLSRPIHLTHFHYPSEEFINYLDWVAAEAGTSRVEEWKKGMYKEVIKHIENQHDGYRDTNRYHYC